MERRGYLAAIGSVGAAALAGCGGLGDSSTLSNPTVHTESPQRQSLEFSADGEEIASFGVSGSVDRGVVDIGTELWHREGTSVQSIALDVWMPTSGDGAGTETVAVAAPVQGDSSPPPEITLSTDPQRSRSVVRITDLDDLADETISTLDLLVRPRSNPSTTVAIDAVIELGSDGLVATDYTLDGRLDLEFPSLRSGSTEG